MAKHQILVRLEAKIVWMFGFDADSGQWLGTCPALNLNAGGDTFEELTSIVSETMQLLFVDLFESGELEAFLRERGWRQPVPLPAPGASPRFDVGYSSERVPLDQLLQRA